MFHSKAAQKDLCLIAIDRPGFGDSDIDENHSIKKYISEDVPQLIRKMVPEATQISMLGISGGGPYVAASLVYWPDDLPPIKNAVFCSGMTPSDPRISSCSFKFRLMFGMFGWSWYVLYPLFWLQAWMMKSIAKSYLDPKGDKESIKNKMKGAMTTVDFTALSQRTEDGSEYFNKFMGFLQDAYKNPDFLNVFIRQAWQYNMDPGYQMSDIVTNAKVTVFQGGMDTQVPKEVGELISSEISGAELKLYPNEGHVSIMINQQEEIMNACL